ncbi:hypothetical protein AVEN_123643-1 [Araneus ventricosus]|uniref:Uncharacterized protein n=1 Tax=Araneus ventricosus TaxID=182803 RepID=A0A4Y2WJV1_ARAVE|nr:hypothetical protein AVEN_123643-1 [Araneus ventricosus]
MKKFVGSSRTRQLNSILTPQRCVQNSQKKSTSLVLKFKDGRTDLKDDPEKKRRQSHGQGLRTLKVDVFFRKEGLEFLEFMKSYAT